MAAGFAVATGGVAFVTFGFKMSGQENQTETTKESLRMLNQCGPSFMKDQMRSVVVH
jgi:hypothetical protein